MYLVFNRVTKRRDQHKTLEKVFAPSKLITVLSDIKTKGKYTDDLFEVIDLATYAKKVPDDTIYLTPKGTRVRIDPTNHYIQGAGIKVREVSNGRWFYMDRESLRPAK